MEHPGAPDLRRYVGPYRIDALLGRGAMGVVYRGTAPDGRPVAVKALLHTVLSHEEVLVRFEREGRLRFDHPNVVRVLDAGAGADGTPYIVLELLDGETVASWFRRGRPAAAELVDLATQVCRGLGAAHAAGVVHRDLKPANLFRCLDGTIKILDFGIAAAQGQSTRLTAFDAILGTPSYLSPEQAGGRAVVDARTDVWALGAVLYEGITGKPPFVRETPLATVVAVLTEEPPPLPRGVGIPAALAMAVERALRKPREKRWESAAALEAALHGSAEADGTAQSSWMPEAPEENRVVAVLLAEGVADLDRFEGVVREHGGVVLPVVGDRVLGLFGQETWHGDEAHRAVRAALAARRSAAWMGVAAGRVTRRGGGIAGAALLEAERGCAARLGGVAIDAETARALGADVATRPSAEGLFETCEPDAGRTSLRTEEAAHSSPLLGRDAELAQLELALVRVLEEGRALTVLINGPTGIGKTRLRIELERRIDAAGAGFVLLSMRADPNRRASALATFESLLRARAQEGHVVAGWRSLDPEEPVEERRRALATLVGEAITEPGQARERAAFLGELLGVPMGDGVELRSARRDPQLMADRMRLAARDYVEALAERRPVAIVVEDAQWADPASLQLLEELADRLTDRPLLVLLTSRPELHEDRPDLFSGREVVRVDPKGLLPSDVAALAEHVAGRAVSPALAKLVAERTQGNPLYVEQIVLELAARGRLDERAEALPLPLTVEAAVQSRLDCLPPADKELCKRAAVLDRPFVAEEVERLDVVDAPSLLSSLARRDILVSRARSRTTRVFHFRSALVGEVAYRMLADDVRADLHRRVARFLGRTPDAEPEEIARHHERGGEAAVAAERYTQAVLAASRRGDGPTVLRCSERALALGALDPFVLHFARADALRFLGRRDEQGAELGHALRHAATSAERARTLTEHAVWLARTGRTLEAIPAATAAVEAARERGDEEILARALAWQGSVLLGAGRHAEARAALAAAVVGSRTAGPETRALVMEWQGHLLSALGEHGTRLEASRQVVDLYREAGDARRAAGAESNLADAWNRVGAYAEAERALRAALDDCRRVGNRIMEGYALLNLGYALGMLGRGSEAIRALADAAVLAAAVADERLAVAVRVYRARIEALAPAELAELSDAAGRLGMPAIQARALVLAARACLGAGELPAATAFAERALALRDEQGGLEEGEIDVFLAAADALAASGRAVEATSVLARGRERLEQTAAGIADAEWRQQYLTSVPVHVELLSRAAART